MCHVGEIEREEYPGDGSDQHRGARRQASACLAPDSRHANSRISGSAIVMRQKPDAVGPVSARRTSIAPSDSAILPPINAANAQRLAPVPVRRRPFDAVQLGCHLDFLLLRTIVPAPLRP